MVQKIPKVSIITVCFNSEKWIENTIKSVVNQNFQNIEYIIIDGGSTDKTKDIVYKYRTVIDTIVSEEDDGIYNAMNKGVRLANGQYIYFLNSGDYLYDENVLSLIFQNDDAIESYDIIYGDYVYYDENSSELRSGCRPSIADILLCGFCHQTIFAKKAIFEKYGYFNEQYVLSADFDWLLRTILKHNVKIQYIAIPIVFYLKGGIDERLSKEYWYEAPLIIEQNASLKHIMIFALSYPGASLRYLANILLIKHKGITNVSKITTHQ